MIMERVIKTDQNGNMANGWMDLLGDWQQATG